MPAEGAPSRFRAGYCMSRAFWGDSGRAGRSTAHNRRPRTHNRHAIPSGVHKLYGAALIPLLMHFAFFASGAAALVYEALWMRRFSVVLGATAPATAAT